ncbi:MAG TPA: diguanylate cyclase response regulator [Planktothrix sp. UBA8407]|jgi:diguanylate cyclase (GGDEF) domain|nr:diguanylate cyclase response regulator [Planktothrix sp. UBA8407]HBK23755.1 diguanylate cyclase response regulator [Planktothrix sp. UBA10369]
MLNLNTPGCIPAMNQTQLKPYIIIVMEETNLFNFRSLVNLLNQLNLNFVISNDPESAIFHAEYSNPDIIIIPFDPDRANCQETYQKLKQAKITENVPLLWMNSYSEINNQTPQSLAAIFNALNSSINFNNSGNNLSPDITIKTLKTQVQLQQELLIKLEAENLQLKRLAALDDLTQVANRRQFYTYLQEQWQSCEGGYLSMILCDVDFFKLYNDTYGHLAGDYCLQQVANAIETAVNRVRETEPYLVARYGGEEFAVILPEVDVENARKIAEEIQLQIRSLHISHFSSPISSFITNSSGVACAIPGNNSCLQELISAADQAMYQAKFQGRDQVKVAPKTIE